MMLDQVLSFALKLMLVQDVQMASGSATVQFTSGVRAKMEVDSKDFNYYVQLAYRSSERHQPVAVDIAAGTTIVRMRRAENDLIGFLLDSPDEMTVGFQRHAGRYHLPRNHPEFRRISNLLRHAQTSNSTIWFAFGGEGIIEDAIPGT